jgi:hypothetical protein
MLDDDGCPVRTCRIRSTIGAVCALALGSLASCDSRSSPDLILHNAKVFTASPDRLWAEAVAVSGERVVGVGSAQQVLATAGADTRTVDAGGRVIVPGFNDAHWHPGFVFIDSEDLGFGPPPADPTLDEVLDSVRAAVARTPAGTWVWAPVGGTVFSDPRTGRAVLDDAAPDHPVMLSGWGGHGRVLNTAAEMAVTPWLEERFPGLARADSLSNGGIRHGYGGFRVDLALVRPLDSVTVAAFEREQAAALEWGMTSIQVLGYPLDARGVVAALEQVGPQLRWSLRRMPTDMDALERTSPPLAGPPLYSEDGLKVILDGSPVERMALQRAPYADMPGWRGRTYVTMAQLRAAIELSLETDEPLAVHAVGDSAIGLLFRTMREYEQADWPARRVRIEHGDGMRPDLVPDARELGVVVVQNPSHLSLVDLFERRHGGARAGMLPLRSLLRAGVPLALGSDGPPNPFLNIMFAAMHPANPDEALSVEEAVIAYTRGSAYAQFAEADKGTIDTGKLADFAVLSQDIFEVPLDQLPATVSLLTLLGGRIVHAAAPFDGVR